MFGEISGDCVDVAMVDYVVSWLKSLRRSLCDSVMDVVDDLENERWIRQAALASTDFDRYLGMDRNVHFTLARHG
jgi:hypothetical protein